jgi:hypothetical protein
MIAEKHGRTRLAAGRRAASASGCLHASTGWHRRAHRRWPPYLLRPRRQRCRTRRSTCRSQGWERVGRRATGSARPLRRTPSEGRSAGGRRRTEQDEGVLLVLLDKFVPPALAVAHRHLRHKVVGDLKLGRCAAAAARRGNGRRRRHCGRQRSRAAGGRRHEVGRRRRREPERAEGQEGEHRGRGVLLMRVRREIGCLAPRCRRALQRGHRHRSLV